VYHKIMAGCYGSSAEDRYNERLLDEFTDRYEFTEDFDYDKDNSNNILDEEEEII
jgi:hypothetical protein